MSSASKPRRSVGKSISQVDVWDELLVSMYNDLGEPYVEQILFCYDDFDEITEDNSEDEDMTVQKFSDVINSKGDRHSCAVYLQKQLQHLNLHTGHGVGYVQLVNTFIEQLTEYCNRFTIEANHVFMGRDDDVELIKDKFLQDTNIIGVSVCGIGGQGKSSLAKQVCWKLQQHKWAVVMVDLSGVKRPEDMLRSMLSAVDQHLSPSSDLTQLMNLMKNFVLDLDDKDVVFFLDDCDQMRREEEQRLLSVLAQLMTMFSDKGGAQHCKIRLLITTREKVPIQHAAFFEHELLPLSTEDGAALLRTCSNQESMTNEEANEIVLKCACSPLAITVTSELLRNEKFTPKRLIVHLNLDEKNISKGLGVHHRIKDAIEYLDTIHQEVLVRLSVFQASSFNIRGLNKVLSDMDQDPSAKKCILQKLHNCHLIEVEIYRKGKCSLKDDVHKKNWYSLHPLVYQYLSEWKKPAHLQQAYRAAVQKFVSLYENIMADIVKAMDSTYFRGLKKLEKHKVHIQEYFNIMADKSHLLDPHPKKTKKNDWLTKKRVSDLSDILTSNVVKRRMFMSEADRAKKVKNRSAYIFWKVEEADVYLMLHDQVEIAIVILDELSDGRFPELRNFHPDAFYEPMVHGLFHKVKGLCRWKQYRYEEALRHLQLSIKFHAQSEAPDGFTARIKCFMGQIYLDLGDLNKAQQTLTEGFDMVKRQIRIKEKPEEVSKNNASQQQELASELHWKLPDYYYHFALIKIKLAEHAADDNRRNELLDNAMENLARGMELDEKLKLSYLDNYLKKMYAQADIYILKGCLDLALKKAEKVKDRRRVILQPPHIHYTLSIYQVAKIYMLQGNELMSQGKKEEAGTYWICSSDYFKELEEDHLVEGGINLKHSMFPEIKRNHIEIVQLAGEENVNKIIAFYKKLESGGFRRQAASRTKAVVNMLWTPAEAIKKFFGASSGQSQEFGEHEDEIQMLEDVGHENAYRMVMGDGNVGGRKDSGMGSCSDYGSVSSGSGSYSGRDSTGHCGDPGRNSGSHSGSVSDQMARVTLQHSNSKDEVFILQAAEEGAVATGKRKSKRLRTQDIPE